MCNYEGKVGCIHVKNRQTYCTRWFIYEIPDLSYYGSWSITILCIGYAFQCCLSKCALSPKNSKSMGISSYAV